jgi:hypothetical protein
MDSAQGKHASQSDNALQQIFVIQTEFLAAAHRKILESPSNNEHGNKARSS